MPQPILPVVLSGGSGSRLWPVSRTAYPKQFLNLSEDLSGALSLLQATIQRVEKDTGFLSPLLVCNEDHRFLVAEQVRALGVTPTGILLEPEGKNTAPAVALAALLALEHSFEGGEEPVLLVLPSDHHMPDQKAFLDVVETGLHLVGQGYMVTFGITPARAETGYGYIELGTDIDGYGHQVSRFVEKPDTTTAQAYVDSGNYLWNAGIFMFTPSHYMALLETHAPEVAKCARAAFAVRTTDTLDMGAFSFVRPEKEAFAMCPDISIDYALAEKCQRMAVVPLGAHWSDIGGWQAIWEESRKDENGNALKGDVIARGTEGSLIRSEHGLVAAVGVKDAVIVQTKDATLVTTKESSQKVKDIFSQLKKEGREEYIFHKRVYRPWGFYENLDDGKGFLVKRIQVKPGGVLSLQLHHKRAEHWVVVRGTATVTVGERHFDMQADESVYIPVETKHRLENRTSLPLELVEVQTGSELREDDIERFEDVYGRSGEKPKTAETITAEEGVLQAAQVKARKVMVL